MTGPRTDRVSTEKGGESTARAGEVRRRVAWWRPVALMTAVLALLLLARLFNLGEQVMALREWMESLGAWAPLIFVFLYTGAVVAAIPGSALTILAGGLFGAVVGVVVVSAGATLGASLCFLIARYFARDAMVQWLSRHERFRRLDELTERHGAIIVALTRLVPLFPFNLLNYGFGLTRVPFWTYVFWSWLCMLPATVLFVVGADAFTTGIAEGRVPWALVGTVAAAAVLLAFLVRFARKKLQEKHSAGTP